MAKTKLIIDQYVAKLSICHPEKHNAFDDEIIHELRTHLFNIRKMNGIRALLLTAEGKHFCSGADLGWMKRMATLSEADNLKDAQELAGLMADLYTLPFPSIVAIQGAAYGGAIGLIACSDIAIASEKARFCLSEVKLGLAPATIGPYVIAAMGARRCAQLFMTADLFSAKQAQDYGLLHQVVEHNELDAAVKQTIKQLLAAGPEANKSAKQLIRKCQTPIEKDLKEDLENFTSTMIAKLRVSEEGQEGLQAFFEKRPPSWLNNI
mgnify:CR=1 FL=1|tara:strand:- start:17900 stop:18694 length:795 start_codon:yes stop_codon:yes gene_type:complete